MEQVYVYLKFQGYNHTVHSWPYFNHTTGQRLELAPLYDPILG